MTKRLVLNVKTNTVDRMVRELSKQSYISIYVIEKSNENTLTEH